MRNKPKKHIGKVIAIKYSEGDEHPRLHIDSKGYSSFDSSDGYAIVNPELMKKVHRTLATGDVVVFLVGNAPDGIVELVNFGIIKQHEPKQGEVRKLRIDQWEGQFRILGTAGAEPGDIDMSDSDWDLLEQGDCVFSLTWDANYQGGNGVECIVRLGSTYYCNASWGTFGPFSSLREALRWMEFDTFNSVTESIDCSEMDSETIAGLLQPQDDVESGFKFWINGEEWELSEEGTLRKIVGEENETAEEYEPTDQVGMRVPHTIDEHSDEHKAHVCKFLGISEEEYGAWLANRNYNQAKSYMHFLDRIRDKIDKSLKHKSPLSITLEEAIRLFDIEDWTLTQQQQKALVKLINEMLVSEEQPLAWFVGNHERLKVSLELFFSEI